MTDENSAKMDEEQFILRAIRRLRKPPYKGIHTVYSGFNEAFKQFYGKSAIEITTRMAQDGKIITRPVKGGVMMYLPGEAPVGKVTAAQAALAKILASDE